MSLIRELWILLREGVKEFFEDNAQSHGAAISFYAMVAMGPVLYICAWVAGLFLGSKAANSHLIYELRRVVGPDTAAMLQTTIFATGHSSGGILPTLMGIVILVLTAGGVFVEVETALNRMWKAPIPTFSYWQITRSWLESIALVGGLGVLLCVSLLINAAIGACGDAFHRLFGIGSSLVWFLNFLVSAGLITFLFAAIYRLLPNRTLQWRDVMVGAGITTVLILIGEYLIAYYLAATALAHRYGTAGGAMAILIWLYYSVQVFLLGAEITKVWSRRHGSPLARAASLFRLDRVG